MFQFDSELESEEDGGKRERADSLVFLEVMELPLSLALPGGNPWAEGGIDEPLWVVWHKPLRKYPKGAIMKVIPIQVPRGSCTMLMMTGAMVIE